MFAQKIESIEAQIRQLQEQQAKYQSLHAETTNALDLIAKIREQAAALGEVETVSQMFLGVLQPEPTDAPAPQQPDLESCVEQEVLETPLPIEAKLERRVEAVAEKYQDEKLLSDAMALETPTTEELQSSLVEQSEPYSTREELIEALSGDDVDTHLMGIANVLDSAAAVDIPGKVWFFVSNMKPELCDRIIPYLPKSIVPEWRKQVKAVEQEARASLFPEPVAVIPNEYEPQRDDIVECLSNGMVGRVVHLNDSPNGRMASVLLPGGTSNFHVSNLKYIGKHEEETVSTSEDSEIDQLAKQCLGLRSWSQMRIFADSNPAVIIRMLEIASTKAEKRVVNNLPSLVLGYIHRANDRSDLGWLPEPVLSEVEVLLSQRQQQSIA